MATSNRENICTELDDDFDIHGWGHLSISPYEIVDRNSVSPHKKTSRRSFVRKSSDAFIKKPGSNDIQPRQVGTPLGLQIFSPQNLGLLNFARSQPTYVIKRPPEVANIVRLNMAKTYLKCIIEALLYLLITYFLGVALTFCFKLSPYILLPAIILCATQLAARKMHSFRNKMHESHPEKQISLARDCKWVGKKIQGLVDQASEFSLGLFAFVPEKIAKTSLLDRQMAYIPDNSYKGFR